MELASLSPYVVLGIGIALMGLEMLLGSFYIFWFGLGFFIVGILSFFIPFGGFLYQSATACAIALVLLFALKKKVVDFLNRSEKEITSDFLHDKGKGVIKHDMVEFKGTMWEYEPKNLDVKTGTIVKIVKTEKNVATIELV